MWNHHVVLRQNSPCLVHDSLKSTWLYLVSCSISSLKSLYDTLPQVCSRGRCVTAGQGISRNVQNKEQIQASLFVYRPQGFFFLNHVRVHTCVHRLFRFNLYSRNVKHPACWTTMFWTVCYSNKNRAFETRGMKIWRPWSFFFTNGFYRVEEGWHQCCQNQNQSVKLRQNLRPMLIFPPNRKVNFFKWSQTSFASI